MSVVITGNPGVGKHTVAKKIADMTDLDIVDTSEIAIKHGIVEKSKESLDVDVEKLQKILTGMVSDRSLVLGHLAPYVLEEHQIRVAIILRKNPYKLEDIYKKRGYSMEKIVENQTSEILGITAYDTMVKFGRKKTIQVDTSNRSVEDTVNVVHDALSGKDPGDEVDWLEMVKCKKDLQKFFPTD